ncbi:hypothetical protein [Terrarubrum flagellatum]|uniref:hypothetical protein n=1 Tax=Terrirubrum flagellatum TaxID=2895980 RepID=UPI0031453671
MLGFSPATIAACTVAALAITTAIMPTGLKAQAGLKDETRLAQVADAPVSQRAMLKRGGGSMDGCLTMTERKLRPDGGYDVNQFRVCE